MPFRALYRRFPKFFDRVWRVITFPLPGFQDHRFPISEDPPVPPISEYRTEEHPLGEVFVDLTQQYVVSYTTYCSDRALWAVFFSQVGYKPTSEWKEEIVFWDPLHSAAVPGSVAPGVDAIDKAVKASNQIAQGLAEPMSENGPLTTVFPDGTKTIIPANRDPREAFADWLIRPENPWFVRAIANRTWAWAMGRGENEWDG